MSNKIGVSLSLDLTKIDKSRIVTGSKGKYIDLTAFIDLDQLDQYGNSGMITQNVSKEEREKGVKGPILGNSKVFWRDNGQPAGNQQSDRQGQSQGAQGGGFDDFDDPDSIPF